MNSGLTTQLGGIPSSGNIDISSFRMLALAVQGSGKATSDPECIILAIDWRGHSYIYREV